MGIRNQPNKPRRNLWMCESRNLTMYFPQKMFSTGTKQFDYGGVHSSMVRVKKKSVVTKKCLAVLQFGSRFKFGSRFYGFRECGEEKELGGAFHLFGQGLVYHFRR
jgi:hypothetical protein